MYLKDASPNETTMQNNFGDRIYSTTRMMQKKDHVFRIHEMEGTP